MLRGVSATGPRRERHVADLHQQVPVLDDPIADHVDHLAFALHAPFQPDHRRRHHCAMLRLETIRPQDPVGDAGFILDGDEQHAFGAARLLPDKDDARHLDVAAITDGAQVGTRAHALSGQLVAHEA